MDRLAMVMRIQAIAFLAYAVGWFFVPDLINDTILGWETETMWPRALGAVFGAVGWAEWQVVNRLEERLDLVWMFAAIPLLLLAALLWEMLGDTYTGSNAFMAVSVAVTVFFGAAVTWLRVEIDRDEAAA